MKTEEDKSQAYLDSLNKEIEGMSDYEQLISRSLLLLGEAICLVLQRHDEAVLKKMRGACTDIFAQAMETLQHNSRSIQ